MNEDNFIHITIGTHEGKFIAYLPLSSFISNTTKDLEPLLKKAVDIYERYIERMRKIVKDVETRRRSHKIVLARSIWQIGDIIFRLVAEMKANQLEPDSLYQNLERDLGIKRKRLEKFIIFRRYIGDINLIPESLNWGKCEKGTRKVAENIQKGTFSF